MSDFLTRTLPAHRLRHFGPTVFAEYTRLANEHNAINLGQGFPDFTAPDFIKQAAQAAIAADLNQYARGMGHPRLVNALAATYEPLFGRELDPMTDIVVTTGATEGIFATMQAFIDPGDEVILLEPFYDSYPAAVEMAGGEPVFVPLRFPADAHSASEWTLEMDELRAALTPRTKMIILNTPMNPVGKVFRRNELQALADFAIAHDLLVLSDEVYEWMVYPPAEHVRIATLPGMWERTITLGSAGKSFSVTGWKIGWAIAPTRLAGAINLAHQWIPFAVATPLQEAVAIALEEAQKGSYFLWLAEMYQSKRDRLMQALLEAGLTPIRPDGSYFIVADTSALDLPQTDGLRDSVVAKWLTKEIGVCAIPPSAFYYQGHATMAGNLARFAFCKTDALLDAAAIRLRTLTDRAEFSSAHKRKP